MKSSLLQKLVEQIVQEELRDMDEDLETRRMMAKDLEQDFPGGVNIDRVDIWSPTPENIARMIQQGRSVKKVFNKYADRNWLQTLILVHGCKYRQLEKILGPGHPNSKDEISTRAFEPGEFNRNTTYSNKPYGVVLKGHITLLARSMNDLYTGFGKDYASHDPKRVKSSGANKGIGQMYPPEEYADLDPILILDKEDWDEAYDKNINEALVDNWRPVLVYTTYGEDFREDAQELVDKYGLDIPVVTGKEAEDVL